MTQKYSKWQSGELATTFLQGIRGAIPTADLQLELLGKIVDAWCPKPACILDLGCGDGVLGRSLMDRFPAARFVFADFSDPMLTAAEAQLKDKPRVTLVKTDFSSPRWLGAIIGLQPVDVVVSGFAIHHQPDQRKKELYGEIYKLLSDNGLFLNLDHVLPPTESVENLFDTYFVDQLCRFHQMQDSSKSRDEVMQKYHERLDKDENLLAAVEDQCKWLRRIGFVDVDCFFKVFELALFGGRKTARPSTLNPCP